MPALKFFSKNRRDSARAPTRRGFSSTDVAVYVCLMALGVFQLTHFLHTADFVNDVTHPDLARSLLQKGSCQIRFLPETTFPPGFAILLAVVGLLFGITPATMFTAVAVSTTLGFIAAYERLVQVEGRPLASAACLLFAASPPLFAFNTVVVYQEMSYLLASMLSPLVVVKIDRAKSGTTPIGWMLFLSLTLTSAIFIRSVGVALLVALVAWIAASLLWFRKLAGSGSEHS